MALFGEKATVSEGTISNLEQRTSEAIKPAYDEALDAIQNAEFVHCDETGWWQGNDRAWLWAAVTPMLKVFRIDPRRNREAFRKLLFAFTGFLITDRFSVYRAHDTKKRQLCGRTCSATSWDWKSEEGRPEASGSRASRSSRTYSANGIASEEARSHGGDSGAN